MEKMVHKKNIELWNGISDVYHNFRPIPPKIITKIILSWLQTEPDVVVDVGCGTGLSTIIWDDIVKNIIGIEPNDDMRTTAESNTNSKHIIFKKGVSNETNLPPAYADIITVSQAFQWMDIDSTLFEFYRILRDGGVLSIYGHQLPPIMDWEIEKASYELRKKCDKLIYSLEKENHLIHNDKNTFYDRINSFGKFRYSREVAFHSVEKCTPQRFMELTLIHGSDTESVKLLPRTIKKEVNKLLELLNKKCNSEFEIVIPYSMVIAIK